MSNPQNEKVQEFGVHVENINDKDNLARVETGQSEAELSVKQERRLVRKIDFVLLPILCLLYACALLDRVNISAARVDGMGKELGLLNPKQNYYSITLLVFFPFYALFEYASSDRIPQVYTNKLESHPTFSFDV